MKKIISLILVLSLLCLCACGSNGDTQQELSPTTGDNTLAEATEQAMSAEDIYRDYLSKLHRKLNAIVGDDTHLDGFDAQEGMVGVAEIAWENRLDLLKNVGYTILDITDDEIPELLICAVDELTESSCKGTRILCVFSTADNDVKLLYDGNALNSHYLLSDGAAYNEISNGTAIVGAAVYQPTDAGDGFACVDNYFVEFNKEGQAQYYHEQTGRFDPTVAELLDGGSARFDEIVKGFRDQIQSLDITSFVSYEN